MSKAFVALYLPHSQLSKQPLYIIDYQKSAGIEVQVRKLNIFLASKPKIYNDCISVYLFEILVIIIASG